MGLLRMVVQILYRNSILLSSGDFIRWAKRSNDLLVVLCLNISEGKVIAVNYAVCVA